MILAALDALYDRLKTDPAYEIAPSGFSMQKITFAVVIDRVGQLVDIQDVRTPDGSRRRPRRVRVLGAAKSSGSALNPCFLWDNRAYMLGFDPDESGNRAAQAFEAFRQRHLELATTVNSDALDAVCRFLNGWKPESAAAYPVLSDAATTGFGIFQFRGEPGWIHEDPAIESWWMSRDAKNEESPESICLVSGESRTIAKLHEKIKGVAGAQSGGAPLVSFNSPAFESYGREQSLNAPVSVETAFRYGTALNALLDGPGARKHRMILGDSTVAFWTDAPTFVEDVFAEYMAGEKVTAADPAAQDESSRQRLEAFLSVLRGGIGVRSGLLEFDPTIGFHLLGLSPNAGRVSVRFFMQSTLGELLENLRAHHRAIRQTPAPAVGKYRGDPEFPALSLLLRQTGRDAKDIPPVLAGPLLESVLTRARYPSGLYSAVLRRIRADRVVNYLRVCVIAGFLNRNLILEVPVSLDIARQEPAYRLGRLFAALEKTQRDALGENLNRTICDSFYGAASMTPAIVFPRLLRLYQHHRSKLEVGRRVFRDRLVQEIVTALPEFPRNLTLPEQGSFAIGYYHQLRDFYTKREARDTGAERAES